MATNKHIIDVQTKGAKKSEKQIKGVGGALQQQLILEQLHY